ncbi:MAG TPA: hypothetical protein DCE42_10985 [Myxococcales bacterium]|nr:hypothetical protein [Myxococcales bacterium]
MWTLISSGFLSIEMPRQRPTLLLQTRKKDKDMRTLLLGVLAVLLFCGLLQRGLFAHQKTPTTHRSATSRPATSRPVNSSSATSKPTSRPQRTRQQVNIILKQVAAIHGAPGPFAVAGYRMGMYAKRHFGLAYGGWHLLVSHYTPPKVQYSCLADGLQAATGTSPGKMNLRMHFVKLAHMRTVITHRKSGVSLIFRLRQDFLKTYLNTPRKDLKRAGGLVARLPYTNIFDVHVRP